MANPFETNILGQVPDQNPIMNPETLAGLGLGAGYVANQTGGQASTSGRLSSFAQKILQSDAARMGQRNLPNLIGQPQTTTPRLVGPSTPPQYTGPTPGRITPGTQVVPTGQAPAVRSVGGAPAIQPAQVTSVTTTTPTNRGASSYDYRVNTTRNPYGTGSRFSNLFKGLVKGAVGPVGFVTTPTEMGDGTLDGANRRAIEQGKPAPYPEAPGYIPQYEFLPNDLTIAAAAAAADAPQPQGRTPEEYRMYRAENPLQKPEAAPRLSISNFKEVLGSLFAESVNPSVEPTGQVPLNVTKVAQAEAGQGTVLAEPTAPQFTIPNLPLNTQPIGSLTSDQLTDLLKVTEQPQPSRLGTVTLPTGEVRNVEASFTLPSGEVRQIIEGQSIPQAFGRPDDGMRTFQVDGGQVSVPMDQAVQTLDLGEAARAREAQQRFLASPESAEMSSRMLRAYSDPMAQASAAREARLAARPDFMQAQPTVRNASGSSLTKEQATRLSGGDKGIAQRIAELSKMGRDPLTGELPKQKTEQEKQLEEARLKLIEAQTKAAQRKEPAPDPEAERIERETAQARLNLINQQVEAAGKKDPDKLARVTAEADRLISAEPPILPAESRQAYILSQMGIDVDEILGSGLTPTAPTGGSNAAEPKDHKSANDAAKAAGQDTYTFQGKKYKVQ